MWTDAPLFPDSASTISGRVDLLYLFIWAIAILFTGLVSLLVLVFVVKYRKRDGHSSHQIEGSLKLEIFWSVVPLIVGLIIFFWSATLYFETSTPPINSMDVYVTGKQWMWRMQHPQGQREINELHVPLGEPVRLTMISEDVIHSFYIPAFRMKMDVLPGKYTEAWFEATKAGEYHLFCAEYCGTKHSAMGGTIHVMEPTAYEAWLLGNTGENLSADQAGAKLFKELRCATCHPSAIEETEGARGPWLGGAFDKQVPLENGATALFDENYIRESILQPSKKVAKGYEAIMPTFEGQVSEEQILQLIAYIKSLDSGDEPSPSEPASTGSPR